MALTGKYAKLRDDIREALLKGEVAEMVSGNDWGTCNFDSPTLYLPRWKKELVEQAAKEAGTHCWKLGYGYWKGFYLISPNTHSQGNPRTANAEAMHDHFNSLGYTSGVYYMMD
jgi:hypothetical protein